MLLFITFALTMWYPSQCYNHKHTILTYSIRQSHFCDTARIGQPHRNPRVSHYETQIQTLWC